MEKHIQIPPLFHLKVQKNLKKQMVVGKATKKSKTKLNRSLLVILPQVMLPLRVQKCALSVILISGVVRVASALYAFPSSYSTKVCVIALGAGNQYALIAHPAQTPSLYAVQRMIRMRRCGYVTSVRHTSH